MTYHEVRVVWDGIAEYHIAVITLSIENKKLSISWNPETLKQK